MSQSLGQPGGQVKQQQKLNLILPQGLSTQNQNSPQNSFPVRGGRERNQRASVRSMSNGVQKLSKEDFPLNPDPFQVPSPPVSTTHLHANSKNILLSNPRMAVKPISSSVTRPLTNEKQFRKRPLNNDLQLFIEEFVKPKETPKSKIETGSNEEHESKEVKGIGLSSQTSQRRKLVPSSGSAFGMVDLYDKKTSEQIRRLSPFVTNKELLHHNLQYLEGVQKA